MRKNNKKTFTFTILSACMLLAACGTKDNKTAEEVTEVTTEASTDTVTDTETAKDEGTESTDVVEEVEETAIQETAETVKTDIEDTTETENNESISEEKGVPWDDMSPVNIKDFPAGITGSVDENDVFFPDILFPSECTMEDGICRANLGDKDYSAYAYVETHARTIADGGEMYFEQAGDFIIYTKDSVNNIEIKDTVHNYLIHISVVIWGADDTFMDEYLLRNCEYIKEQIEKGAGNDNQAAEEAETELPEGSAQGNIPYGYYKCAENGKGADIDVEDGEADVIIFDGEHWEGMYDIIWTGGNTYRIELGEISGTAVMDADGNMQITAESEELKPYEGYYQITFVDDDLRKMYNN